MTTELKITQDGSHTLFVPELNEHYHSTFGAIQESEHIFINNGFNALTIEGAVNILEIGFGTGLNALLTYFEAEKREKKVKYVSVEPEPLSEEIYSILNYPVLLNYKNSKDVFLKIHSTQWGTDIFISDNFSIHKIKNRIEDVDLVKEKFHLVYFDAFAPDVQPELWTEQVFRKLFDSMTYGAMLLTYSSKGDVKRALKSSGFLVEKLAGPAGKREIIRAKK